MRIQIKRDELLKLLNSDKLGSSQLSLQGDDLACEGWDSHETSWRLRCHVVVEAADEPGPHAIPRDLVRAVRAAAAETLLLEFSRGQLKLREPDGHVEFALPSALPVIPPWDDVAVDEWRQWAAPPIVWLPTWNDERPIMDCLDANGEHIYALNHLGTLACCENFLMADAIVPIAAIAAIGLLGEDVMVGVADDRLWLRGTRGEARVKLRSCARIGVDAAFAAYSSNRGASIELSAQVAGELHAILAGAGSRSGEVATVKLTASGGDVTAACSGAMNVETTIDAMVEGDIDMRLLSKELEQALANVTLDVRMTVVGPAHNQMLVEHGSTSYIVTRVRDAH